MKIKGPAMITRGLYATSFLYIEITEHYFKKIN